MLSVASANSPEQEAYLRDGYVVVRGVFSPGEISRMSEAFDRLAETARRLRTTRMVRGSQFVVSAPAGAEDDEVQIQRVVWCGAAEPILGSLGKDPRLVRLASQLLGGGEFDQLINQAHFKFPGDGVRFDWHQDSRHRRYGTDLWTDVDGRGSFVEIVAALDPMTADNGPIEFIPGSQNLGHIQPLEGTNALPRGVFDPAEAVTVTLDPGDVVAFGPFVIHGSKPNTSAQPRRSFLNGFSLPGANHRIYPGEGAGRRVRL